MPRRPSAPRPRDFGQALLEAAAMLKKAAPLSLGYSKREWQSGRPGLPRRIQMFHLPKIILASGSPRRAQILTSVGWEFEKHVADIDETEGENELSEDY